MVIRAPVSSVVLLLVLTSCGGADDASTNTAGAAAAGTSTTSSQRSATVAGDSIGPAGGTITSDDERFTIEFPPGSLTEETSITISQVDPADAGFTDSSLLAGAVYDIGPFGLELASPATTVRTLSATDLDLAVDEVPFIHVFQGEGTEWELLNSVSTRDETGSVIVRADTTHFSQNMAGRVDTTFGSPVGLIMSPASFESVVGGGQTVTLRLESDAELIVEDTYAFTEASGALVSFREQSELVLEAVCGDSPGSGTYTVAVNIDVSNEGPAWEFVNAVVAGEDVALRSRTEQTYVGAIGAATCVAVESPVPDVSSFLAGSFGGALSFQSVLDDGVYESEFLLSVLDPNSAGAVLTSEAQALGDRIEALVTDAGFVTIEDVRIILSQIGAGGGSQNTFGAAADLSDGTVGLFTASIEESYAEFYWIVLDFCDGFPGECTDVTLAVTTVGGSPNADLERVFRELWASRGRQLEDLFEQGQLQWFYDGSGNLEREAGTPGG